jgi:hypothetical protein
MAEIMGPAQDEISKNTQDFGTIMHDVDHKLDHLDLAGCPQDFKEAVIDYISAIDLLLVQYDLSPQGFWAAAGAEAGDLLAGRSYDSTLNESKDKYIKCCLSLQDAKMRLLKVAAEYDVN